MFRVNKDVLWIAGGQIAGLLNNFLLLKILTVSLSMAAYGYYALWVSVILFVRQIIYDPISIIAAKESIKNNFLGVSGLSGFQVVKNATNILMIGLTLSGFFFISIEIVFYRRFSIGPYILVGLTYLVCNGAQGIYLNLLNIQKKRKWAAAGIAADSFVKLCLVSLVFLFFERNIFSALHAIALSSLLVFIWVRGISKKFYSTLTMTATEQWIVAKKLIILSLPLLAPTLLIALKGIGDKVFIASFIGVEELAAYNVLLQLGFIPMILIVGVIQTYVSPDIYKFSSTEKDAEKHTIAYLFSINLKILIFSGVVTCISIVFSSAIFKILVGVEYLNYSKFLPYFVMAGALAGMSGLLNVGVIGAFKSKLVGVLMCASVLVGLIALTFLILLRGFEGGVAGLVLSNLVMMFIFGCSLWFIPFKRNE